MARTRTLEFGAEETTPAPPSAAFAWYSDFSPEDPRLMGFPAARVVRPLADDCLEVVTRAPWPLRFLRARYLVALQPEALAYDARVRGPLFVADARYEFLPDPAGTRVRIRWRARVRGPAVLVPRWLARLALRVATRRLLRALARDVSSREGRRRRPAEAKA